MSSFTVNIIIPNWNGRVLLEKHLPSVVAAVGKSEIIIVDDASGDDSIDFVKTHYPNIHIVAKEKNEGFASTVNAGVAKATGDIVVLLNTDVAPTKGFLPPLIAHFSDPAVFAVGCMDRSHEGGHIELRGRGLARWEKGFFVHRRGEVDRETTAWVNGGSGAYRRLYWQKLGGMDTLYNPFYWEDIDLSYRALKAGYHLVFEPKSIVDHFHEEGKIKSVYTEKKVKQIAYRNQFIFIWKNLTDMNMLAEHVFWLPVRLVQAVVRGDVQMLKGFVHAIFTLPKIAARRSLYKGLYKIRDQGVQLT